SPPAADLDAGLLSGQGRGWNGGGRADPASAEPGPAPAREAAPLSRAEALLEAARPYSPNGGSAPQAQPHGGIPLRKALLAFRSGGPLRDGPEAAHSDHHL